jgi:hypothetical protein
MTPLTPEEIQRMFEEFQLGDATERDRFSQFEQPVPGVPHLEVFFYLDASSTPEVPDFGVTHGRLA